MSFPRYPAYKPSGVEWLGDVPEHWNALPLRRLIRQVTSGTSVNAIDEPASHGQAGVLKTSCVYTGEFRPEENKAILESELDRATCPVVAGTLVVSRMNTPDLVGAAGLVKNNDPYLFLPDRLWLVSFQDCDPQFMNYWCKSVSYRSQVQLACSGTSSSMQNLSQDNFYSFIAPLPPTGEQSAIATFLDRETAKMDALIAEQQRLIELLQEKRQAVISHAVTKGLNPNVPMKDSGVEWLGEVPEHWEVARYKRFCELQRGHDLTGDEREEGPYPVVTSGGINGFHSEFIAKAPGVVTGRYGSTGTVFYVDDDYWPHNTSLYIKDFHGNSPRFSWYLLQVIDLKSLSVKSAVPGIDRNDVHALFVAFPHQQEQVEIASCLDDYCEKQSLLTEEAENSVRLFQERRSALISAAVTGQIDVRGQVEAEAGGK